MISNSRQPPASLGYQHSERHQELLRDALKIAHLKMSDADLVRLLEDEHLKPNGVDASITRTSIGRFRDQTTKAIKNRDVAEGLWNILVKREIISLGFMQRYFRPSVDEIALQTNTILETHHSQFAQAIGTRCYGLFFGYKRAFRPHHIVRSLFIIRPSAGWLEISEYQKSKANRDPDGTESHERSVGYGVIKSENVWFFLKERDFQQPRIFCFHRRKLSELPSEKQVNILWGNCFETSRKFASDREAFASPAVLVRVAESKPDAYKDKRLIRRLLQTELDMFKFDEAGLIASSDERGTQRLLHREILNYLLDRRKGDLS